MTTYPIEKTEAQWRDELSPDEFRVLRQAGTERAGTGKLLYEDRVGVYSCRACGQELFRSQDAKEGLAAFAQKRAGQFRGR